MTAATMVLRTQLHGLPVHYTSRSFVCGGPDCPMCDFERPRKRFYAIAEMMHRPELVELPPTLATTLHDFGHQEHDSDVLGLAVVMRRRKTRSPWSVTDHRWYDVEPVPDCALIEATALLFRIPGADLGDDWPDFYAIAARAHHPYLSGPAV